VSITKLVDTVDLMTKITALSIWRGIFVLRFSESKLAFTAFLHENGGVNKARISFAL